MTHVGRMSVLLQHYSGLAIAFRNCIKRLLLLVELSVIPSTTILSTSNFAFNFELPEQAHIKLDIYADQSETTQL